MDPSDICNELYRLARTRPGETLLDHHSGRRIWVVQNPQDAHLILKANAGNWPKHMAWMRQTLGPSRMSENHDAWTSRRQLTQPHLNHYDVDKTVDASRRALREALPQLIGQTAIGTLPDHLLRTMTLQVLTEVLFDIDFRQTGIDPQHLFRLLELSAQYAFVPAGGLTGDTRRQHLSLLNAAKAQLMQDLRVFRSAEFACKPVIQEMLAAEASARDQTDRFILEQELITLLATGSETSASTFGWACHLLAQHLDAQDQLRDEARRAEAVPTLMDDFLGETMRLFPANPILARYALTDDRLSAGPVLPGDVALVSLVGLQTQESSRKHPWQLDLPASRDLPGRAERGFGTAFGIGERVCGGRLFAITEMRTLLQELLLQARVLPTANEPLEQPLDMQWCSLMVRLGGHRVHIQPLRPHS
ncbi:cytochrome P450 [Ottowia thiooxydans]|uniref:Cytochrome P450 n=1 Tax=Ottowia thiooxydans TaxID=219182 RepID=A0ABV2QHJ6_9BURK